MDSWIVRKTLEVIGDTFEKFSSPAVVWSGGKDSTAMTDLVLRYAEEHGYEQPVVLACDPVPIMENVVYTARMIEYWGLKHVVWYQELLEKRHYREAGPLGADKVRCCHWLKVVPLNEFVEQYGVDALFVAIRWDEHPERAKETYFSPRDNPPHTRVHPMLHWTWKDVWLYIKERGLPVNPLYLKGYLSLGCAPCTVPVTPGFRDVDEIIRFVESGRVPERAGRDIDKEKVMERLRRLGYF